MSWIILTRERNGRSRKNIKRVMKNDELDNGIWMYLMLFNAC
jgi:hypothetical protein